DGFVTEGSSTNIWMITKNGVLVTSPTKNNILPGITRSAILTLASQIQIKYEERAFTIQEAMAGSEMFLTSSTCGAQPIIALDDTPIGTGVSGPIALRLAEEYAAYMTRH
ncbi:MAG: aminotransferase class IV, partial [Kordiimonadaceae bacterium]|nr:aminotransferase class IV [Kordiimonadaceae bacterium]